MYNNKITYLKVSLYFLQPTLQSELPSFESMQNMSLKDQVARVKPGICLLILPPNTLPIVLLLMKPLFLASRGNDE